MFVRAIDPLGRIVIPKELRTTLAMNEGDGIAIYVVDGKIILQKHTAVCFVCNGKDDVQRQNQAYLCKGCRDKLSVDTHEVLEDIAS